MKGNDEVTETLTFYQWLNKYELTTKNEFRTLQKVVQDNLKREYEMWLQGESRYNYYDELT